MSLQQRKGSQQQVPDILESPFQIDWEDPRTVVLHEGRLSIEPTGAGPKHKVAAIGRIWLDLSQRATVLIEAKGDFGIGFMAADTVTVRFDRRRIENVGRRRLSGDVFLGAAHQGYERFTRGKIRRVAFHVVNLKSWFGALISHHGHTYRGRFKLDDLRWSLTLDEPPNTDELVRAGRSGLSPITRTCELKASNRHGWTVPEAKDELAMISLLLEFIAGQPVGPVLCAGFDARDRQVWNWWPNWAIRNYEDRIRWAPFWEGEAVAQLLRGLSARYRQHPDLVRFLIRMYSEPSFLTETGVVIAQSLLERLAYEVVVESLAVLSHDAIAKLSAAEKIGLALKLVGVELALPNDLPALTEFKKPDNQPFASGPELIVFLRNQIAHGFVPKKMGKPRTYGPSKVMAEALQLSRHYAALLMLWFFDYCGNARGVRATARERTVPWVGQRIGPSPTPL